MLSSSYNAVRLFVVAVRVGRGAAQSIASMKVTGVLSPLILGEAVATNVAMSGVAQMEAVFYVITRLSLHSPRRVAWLLDLISRFAARCSGCSAGATSVTSWLAKQSLLRQVAAVGLQSNAVSALATAAVQLGLQTCFLVKSSLLRPARAGLAWRQFGFEARTIAYAGGASIVCGGCGAVAGGLLLPGVGTALGSLVGSLGGGYAPYAVRGDGPEEQLERQRLPAADAPCNPDRPLKVEEGEDEWLIVMDCEKESQFMFYDRIDMEDVKTGPMEGDGGVAEAEGEGETSEDFEKVDAGGEAGDGATEGEFIEFVDGKNLQERFDEIICGDEEMLLVFVPTFDNEETGGDKPAAQIFLEEATGASPGVEPVLGRSAH